MSIEKHFGRISAFKHVVQLCDKFIDEPVENLSKKHNLSYRLVKLTLENVKQFCEESIEVCETNIDEMSKEMIKESTGENYDEVSHGK